jgi:dGTPase
MKTDKFKSVGIFEGNPKWKESICRESPLPQRADDIRTEFARDNNRLLHSTAYRRLKHKTQVFFAPANDHICTRIEHVNHVVSISHTIANYLGLNTELTNAIATGHDLGHAPFGHAGENYLKKIAKEELKKSFWHEKNSLRFVDDIETLEDHKGKHRNLSLTYAVRDGIICHCGEVDENALFPRNNNIDLNSIIKPNEFAPYTWEGCVVKISDKIAYLGRDIEDALSLRMLSISQKEKLLGITQEYGGKKGREINNTILIHNLIIDLCKNSTPDEGIKISKKNVELMNMIKKFNLDHIYFHKRLIVFKEYAELIINNLYRVLKYFWPNNEEDLIGNIKKAWGIYPNLSKIFLDWLLKYSIAPLRRRPNNNYKNKLVYDLSKKEDYLLAIIDFISGMTDNFAIRSFQEIISFS